jgi:hypothetical protein
MALPASGDISLKDAVSGGSIEEEVNEGTVSGTPYAFSTAVADSRPAADPDSNNTPPASFSDFYSHTQTIYGDIYAEESYTGDVYTYDININTVQITGTLEKILNGRSNTWSMDFFKDASETVFDGTEGLAVGVYRRTKNTTGSWTVVTNISNFETGVDDYLCDLSTYDYRFVLT